MNNEDTIPAVNDLMNLEGQRALVTGASGNIGRGIAVRLAEAGADIIVHYVNDAEGAAATAEAVKAVGSDAKTLQADLTRPEKVADMFTAIDESGASPECVVNNAGGYPVKMFADMSATSTGISTVSPGPTSICGPPPTSISPLPWVM